MSNGSRVRPGRCASSKEKGLAPRQQAGWMLWEPVSESSGTEDVRGTGVRRAIVPSPLLLTPVALLVPLGCTDQPRRPARNTEPIGPLPERGAISHPAIRSSKRYGGPHGRLDQAGGGGREGGAAPGNSSDAVRRNANFSYTPIL